MTRVPSLVGKAAVGAVGAAVAGACALVIEQFGHFHQARRADLNDQQPLFHSSTAAHCCVLVSTARVWPDGSRQAGLDLISALDGIRAAVEVAGGMVVYEGAARFPGQGGSSQLVRLCLLHAIFSPIAFST